MKMLFLSVILCQMLATANGQNPVNQLGSREFNRIINDRDGILLDVRTQNEFRNGHIENAGQLNYYALDFKKKILLLPRNQDIYLYCNTGYRSQKAAEILIKNGYTNVYNLEHGTMEWNKNNLPVVIEPNARPDSDNKFLPDQYLELISSDSLVFIDFYAPWCAPCRRMMPMIDSLMVEYHDRVKVVKINIDASKKLIKKLQFTGVPYLVLYQKNQELFTHQGSIMKQEIQRIFDANISRQHKGIVPIE